MERFKLNLSLCIALFGLLCIAGCGGGGDPLLAPPPGMPTREEVAQAFPNGYPRPLSSFRRALQSVVAKEPTVVDDPAKFGRALFEELKATREEDSGYGDDYYGSFTLEELILAILNPRYVWFGQDAPTLAFEGSKSSFPCGANSPEPWNDDKADAVRHAYWIALFAKSIYDAKLTDAKGAHDFAIEFGVAHEAREGNLAQRRQMDLSNNAAGAAVFLKHPAATNAELLEQVVSLPFEYFEPGTTIPMNTSRLAYFSAKALFDGTYTGMITNPEGGGSWNIRLSLNQCGSRIRGEWFVSRSDGSYQRRRVSGELSGSQIALAVHNPYAWEHSNSNLHFCEDMVADLAISPSQISGGWRGRNCPKGGTVSATR